MIAKHWFQIIVVVAALGLLVGPATLESLAQLDPELERLEVDLWSEWDRPEMLIIYRGTLQPGTPLPTSLSFQLPPGIDAPHAVAHSDEAGALFDATYSTQRTDAGLIVTLETPWPSLQLEYYDTLTYDGDLRSYSYVWPGDYAVDQFNVAFLPPSGASQVQTQPPLDAAQQSSGGIVYLGTIGRLGQGQSTQVDVSYRSSGAAQVVVPAAADQDDSSPLPLIAVTAVVVLLGLVIAGVVWYTRRPQPTSASAESQTRRPKSGKKRARSTASKRSPAAARHCTQCGRALGKDDRFCGQCGAPIKGKT